MGGEIATVGLAACSAVACLEVPPSAAIHDAAATPDAAGLTVVRDVTLWGVGSLPSEWPTIVEDLALDPAGRIYVTGHFAATADLGGDLLTSAGLTDVFLASFAPDLTPRWSRGAGSGGTDNGANVTVASDLVHFAGLFQNTVDFGGGPISSAGQDDRYLASYDLDGAHARSAAYGGTGDDDYGGGLFAATNGDLYLSGACRGTVDFGGGPASGGSTRDPFVAVFDATGAYVSLLRWQGPGDDYASAVAAEAGGDVFVGGAFGEGLDLGGGPLVAAGGRDAFLARFAPSGELRWARGFGGEGEDEVRALRIGGDGNLYVAGDLTGAPDLGGGPLATTGTRSGFIASYTADGVLRWAWVVAAAEGSQASGIALGADDTVYVTGQFAGSAVLGNLALENAGLRDVYVAALASGGEPLAASAYGGPGQDEGEAIGVGPDAVYVGGYASAGIDVGAGPLTVPSDPAMFLIALGPP